MKVVVLILLTVQLLSCGRSETLKRKKHREHQSYSPQPPRRQDHPIDYFDYPKHHETIHSIDFPPSRPKECIFLHGAGHPSFSPSTTSFPLYWGNVQDFTPQCSSHVFIHANTVDYPFDAMELMSYYCSTAITGRLGLKHGPSKALKMMDHTKLIKNKIIFTHSMGNNIFAAALRDGVCELDRSSSWYAVSGPFHGSKGADILYLLCSQTIPLALSLQGILEEAGFCNHHNATPAFNSLRRGYPGLIGLADVARNEVSGIFCGLSSWGISKVDSLFLAAISAIVDFGEANDGMVTFESCSMLRGDGEDTLFATYNEMEDDVFHLLREEEEVVALLEESGFSSDVRDAYFAGPYNHRDTSCSSGGVPCLWYSYRN